MGYDSSSAWTNMYSHHDEISYPAEGVIRILKGQFPDLKMPRPEKGSSILDVGCGDGRHMPLFNSLGMQAAGTEVSDQIVEILTERMKSLGVTADIKTGHSSSLPFANNAFDYLLTWNSCYYMSLGDGDFNSRVTEFARVLKPGGWIICSVPKKTSFIFKDSIADERPGYRVVQNDYFGGMRNGEVMRCFESCEDLETTFSEHFASFCHADLDMDWFGLSYRWHIFAAQCK